LQGKENHGRGINGGKEGELRAEIIRGGWSSHGSRVTHPEIRDNQREGRTRGRKLKIRTGPRQQKKKK